MSEIKIYDKASWHYPEGKNCTSLEAALIHLNTIYNWLKDNNLLSIDGEENSPEKFGQDFSLTSGDVTNKGKLVLDKCYDNWLKQIDYVTIPSTNILDECLKNI